MCCFRDAEASFLLKVEGRRFMIEISEADAMHRVVVTGMGAVTPYGAGVALLQRALLQESRSGLKFSDQLGFVVR